MGHHLHIKAQENLKQMAITLWKSLFLTQKSSTK